MALRTMTILVAGLVLAGCGENGAGAGGGEVAMTRDAAVGRPFRSAGPRTCNDSGKAATGAPSPQQAAAYVICSREKELASELYLVSGITVDSVGAGRPYNYLQDNNVPNIDVTKPIYPIRGKLAVMICSRVETAYDAGPRFTAGTNCRLNDEPNASGLCYTDHEGRWACKMHDQNAKFGVRDGLPPPA